MLSFAYLNLSLKKKKKSSVDRIIVIFWINAVFFFFLFFSSVIAVKIVVEISMNYQPVKLSISQVPLLYCTILMKDYNDTTPNIPAISNGIHLFATFSKILKIFLIVEILKITREHSRIHIYLWFICSLLIINCVIYTYLTWQVIRDSLSYSLFSTIKNKFYNLCIPNRLHPVK